MTNFDSIKASSREDIADILVFAWLCGMLCERFPFDEFTKDDVMRIAGLEKGRKLREFYLKWLEKEVEE